LNNHIAQIFILFFLLIIIKRQDQRECGNVNKLIR